MRSPLQIGDPIGLGVVLRFGQSPAVEPTEPQLENLFGGLASAQRAKQVHGNRVVVVEGPRWDCGESDAWITDRPLQYLQVKTADCVPLLMSVIGGQAVGAAHAGWRGTVAGVGSACAQALALRAGVGLERLEVWVGPSIGPCCYTVSPELLDRFEQEFARLAPPEQFLSRERSTLDLWAINRLQLSALGVQKIHTAEICTHCTPEFESFRRDRTERRQISWIRNSGKVEAP